MRVVLRIALVCFSFALVFGVFELILRARGAESPWLHFGSPRVYRADPDLIYSLRPGGALDTNSLGLRGPEISANPRGPRLIALGDSYTYGHELEYASSYPALLEEVLEGREPWGADVEVINAGVPGYNVDQAYTLFVRQLQELNPDWVVLVIEPKDLAGANVLYDFDGEQWGPVPAWKNWIYLQLKLRSVVPEALKESRVYGFVAGYLTGSDPFGTLPESDRDAQAEWQIEKIGWMVEDLVSRGRERGFEVLVVFYPDRPALVHGGDYSKSGYFDLPFLILGARGNEHMARLQEVVDGSGAQTLDAMQVFLRRQASGLDVESLYLDGDPHMNERGNRFLAEVIAGALGSAMERTENER
ncbi:MAG: GDSL-type esterase/lipase family protein [Myxococcota bacterium]|nr:GDSL-type esterase/lipase family protein [Myxococcota bacterium]